MTRLVESEVEAAALEWLERLGYGVASGPDLAPGGTAQERTFTDAVLQGRLSAAVARLNPAIPLDTRDDAVRTLLRRELPALIEENRRIHGLLVNGIEVTYRAAGGNLRHDIVRVVDWADPAANDWLAVNQVTVHESQAKRRADVVVFLNGLPVVVVELKNAASENVGIREAFNQLQTYKTELPGLFAFNGLLIASDGLQARYGSLTAGFDRFMPWHAMDGSEKPGSLELRVLIADLFERRRLLRYLRDFIAFEQDRGEIRKLAAGYHQFHAVETAVDQTVRASSGDGDGRVGVVWHTQGSGKSLTMVYYAGIIARHPAMANPTLVVVTDRNDLDDQLFGQFARCADLLRQVPEQAESREDLQQRLRRVSGGIVFTTMQKFMPEGTRASFPMLSDRRNIIVIADEAHRSQYGFAARLDRASGELSYGFAKYLRDALPNASFIGFTGTPIELTDANTREVFGDYISVYDIDQAVRDHSTVPIYYESRLARLALDATEKPLLDEEFEEVTEGEEVEARERLKSKWAALEAVVGSPTRLEMVARDLVEHFENRLAAVEGKAMAVVMSRRIAVELYAATIALRPEWHDPDDAKGAIKVVMTGSAADDATWQQHIRSKQARDGIARRFKDPRDPLRLVIVRDMWLTGFDVPCLHTMYVDKPMQGHALMQAIARVNRVFRDKPGGLVVDYLGLAAQLREALATYTQGGGKGTVAIDQAEAVAAMIEKYEVVDAILHGFDWRTRFFSSSPAERLSVVGEGTNYVLGMDGGNERFVKAVAELTLAFSLATPAQEALDIRDAVAYFQAVRAALTKQTPRPGRPSDPVDHAVRQLVSQALVSEGVVDIFKVAGLDKPDLSILDEEFLDEIKHVERKNVAVELLRRLLNDEIRVQSRRNLVQSRSFTEMLERALNRYHNRTIEAAQVIEELIQIAKDIKAAKERGAALGLNEDEVAFYDALAENESAVEVLGNDQLRMIATELVSMLRQNVTIDWTLKETVQARLRALVRRILRKYGYPPDLQEKAIQTVLEQATLLADAWAA